MRQLKQKNIDRTRNHRLALRTRPLRPVAIRAHDPLKTFYLLSISRYDPFPPSQFHPGNAKSESVLSFITSRHSWAPLISY
jgi:hypothetical protein